MAPPHPALSIKLELIFFTFSRLVLNASIRMVYPFLPFIAGGLHADLKSLSLVVTVSLSTSALAPFLAPFIERRGRRTGMLLGLIIYCAGSALLVLWPVYAGFFAGMMLVSLGDNLFVPAVQARISDRITYEQRGSALAVLEMSWALSILVAIPLLGLLIQPLGWQAPFVVLLALGAIIMLIILLSIPADVPPPVKEKLFAGLKQVITHPAALAVLLFSIAIVVANELVTMVYGVWMEHSFTLQAAALGAASSVIGMAELAGEGLAAWLADRIGKHRAVLLGLGLNAMAAVALPLFDASLWSTLIWLFLFYLGFEFAIVCSLPIISEILPHARATIMAANIAAFSLGMGLGAWFAPWFYQWGFYANALGSILFNVVAALALARMRITKQK